MHVFHVHISLSKEYARNIKNKVGPSHLIPISSISKLELSFKPIWNHLGFSSVSFKPFLPLVHSPTSLSVHASRRGHKTKSMMFLILISSVRIWQYLSFFKCKSKSFDIKVNSMVTWRTFNSWCRCHKKKEKKNEKGYTHSLIHTLSLRISLKESHSFI